MRDYSFHLVILIVLAGAIANNLYAQNPIIRDQFTADPSARVFGDSVYLYPSHDIPAGEGRGRVGWFCMEDYHVFSSANLTDWIDHGVTLSQDKIPWVNSKAYAMWAPDCIYRNGKYYFYFPAPLRIPHTEGGFQLESPYRIGLMGPLFRSLHQSKMFMELIPTYLSIEMDRLIYAGQGEVFMQRS